MSKSEVFVDKRRKIGLNAENLFKKVIEYFVFCYQLQISDEVKYSRSFIENKTKGKKPENYLRNRFLYDYLRKKKSEFSNKKVERLYFLPEPGVEYEGNGKEGDDLVDIFVTALPQDCINSKYDIEDHYFAFECKRIKNKQTIDNEYLTDITKFISRDYWKTGFRFPFNGMIGFVEHKTPEIPKIIDNLKIKMSAKKYNTVSNLQKYEIHDFDFCEISKHNHITEKKEITVYHLFLNYSKIIVE